MIKIKILVLSSLLFFSCTLYNPFLDSTYTPAEEIKKDTAQSITDKIIIPIATIINPPQQLSTTDNFAFQISGDDVEYYKYSLNDSIFSESSPVSELLELIQIGNGSFNLEVIGGNASQNFQTEENATVITWIVDMNQAQAEISTKPERYTNQTTAQFTISGNEISEYRYELNSNGLSEWILVSESLNIEDLLEGDNTIEIIGKRSSGVEQNTELPTTYLWTVDTTPPTVTFNNKITAITQPNLTGNIDDQYASVIITQNIQEFAATNHGSGIWSLPAGTIAELTDGVNNLSVYAIDRAGNESDHEEGIITLDTENSIALLNSLPDKVTNSTTADISVTDVGFYKYSIDGITWEGGTDGFATTETISLTDLIAGVNTIKVIGKKDIPGSSWQLEENATTYSWTIDLTPPVISLNGDDFVTLNLNDQYTEPVNDVTVEDNYDNDPLLENTSDLDTSIASTYSSIYTATDKAGNQSEITRTITVLKHNTENGEHSFTDEKHFIESSTADRKMYIDFDEHYIYFGYTGENMSETNKTFYFVLNTESTIDSGSNQLHYERYYEGSTFTLPFKAKYVYISKYVVIPGEPTQIARDKRTWDESWSERTYINGDINQQEFFAFTSATPENMSIYAISRNHINAISGKISFVVYMKDLEHDDGNGWLFSVSPVEAAADGLGDRTFSKHYELDLDYIGNPKDALTIIEP